MKEEALKLAGRSTDPNQRLNILREYLQVFALRSLHESQAFERLSFVGGTALRILYDLPRYSEDLDFSFETSEGYEPQKWLAKLKRELEYSGFEASISWNDRPTVHLAWLRISGLMKESALVSRSEEKLSIKIEIDTKPPEGACTETRIVNRFFLFGLRHHDLPSLMAGKINAIVTRPYAQGRDWYDLLWYSSRRPPVEPNPLLLASAHRQFDKGSAESWKSTIRQRIVSLDIDELAADLLPFLERPAEAALLTRENLLRSLE